MYENHLKLNEGKTVFFAHSTQKPYRDFSAIQLVARLFEHIHHTNNLFVISTSDFSENLQISKISQEIPNQTLLKFWCAHL